MIAKLQKENMVLEEQERYQVMYPKLLGKTGQVQSEMPFKNSLQEIFYKLEMRNINRAAVNFRPTGFQMHRRWARRSG